MCGAFGNEMDDLAHLLGKDLTQLICCCAHQAMMADVHREYFGLLKEIRKDGSLAFQLRGVSFSFNYRSSVHFRRIYNWKQYCSWANANDIYLSHNYW